MISLDAVKKVSGNEKFFLLKYWNSLSPSLFLSKLTLYFITLESFIIYTLFVIC